MLLYALPSFHSSPVRAFPREIKLKSGALCDKILIHLPSRGAPHPFTAPLPERARSVVRFDDLPGSQLLATVSPPPLLTERVKSRLLCAHNFPPVQSPSKAHSCTHATRLNVTFRRSQNLDSTLSPLICVSKTQARDIPRAKEFAQCITRGEHGFMLRRRAVLFQEFPWYARLLCLMESSRNDIRACSQGTMWPLGAKLSSRLTRTV